jgi:hypothetical protein
LSFDISICFIISLRIRHLAGRSCGWAADSDDAAGGDVAGVCANKEVASNVARRIVANDVNVFMAGIVPKISGE